MYYFHLMIPRSQNSSGEGLSFIGLSEHLTLVAREQRVNVGECRVPVDD